MSGHQLVQRLQKNHIRTAPPLEVTIPGYECIEQRNCFISTINIHNTQLSEGEAIRTMLAASGWLGMQQRYPQARSIANQLANTAFPLSKEFPFSSTVYNCEALQCLATKWTISL